MSRNQSAEVIDLHSHYIHPRYPPLPPPGSDPALASRLLANISHAADADAQLAIMDERGIDIRVLGASPSLFHRSAPPPESWLKAVNENLAAHVGAHPNRFLGFASIDAFAGERGATEVVRAIAELSLHGIIIDSTDGSALIGSPVTRPTLDAADELRIPVFVHPTSSQASLVVALLGRSGIVLDRGTNNAASLLSLLHHRITRELPDLRLLFAALAVGGLAAAVQLGIEEELRGDGDGGIYIDTMGFAPKLIRFAIDVLGADRVAVGTDWPIQERDASRGLLADTFAEVGLHKAEVAAVSAGNARRFLGLDHPSTEQRGQTGRTAGALRTS